MRIITKGATSQSIYFDILDSTSTTGGRKTGLAYNTSGLAAYYVRNGAAAVAITLATQSAAGAWSSGGFAEVDATNMPGVYRLDVPNAAFASGADSVVIAIRGATGMVGARYDVQLTALDLQQDISSVWDVTIASHTTSGTTGASLNAAGGAGDPWATTLPGSYGAGTAGYAIGTYLTGNAYTRLGAPAGASISADIAAVPGGVWDVTLSSHLTSGTTGNALNAAGASGDPWSTSLPGAYSSGTAGYAIGTYLTGDAYTRLGAPVGASISADVAGVPTAILTEADGIETGYTLKSALRLMFSILCGKVSGLPGSPIFRDVPDTKDRVTATTDTDGNRTAITLDAT